MTRLVNEMRGTIINRMIAHTFGKRIAFLQTEQAACAVAIYEDVFSKKHRDLIDTLPQGWLPTDDDIYVTVDQRNHRFTFSGDFVSSPYNDRGHGELRTHLTKVLRPFPHVKHQACLKVYDAETGLGERLAILLDLADGLQREITEARKKLSATLDSFYTTEKLVTAWPEIEPFVPAPPPPVAPATLPAVPTADLNKLFDLPVSANV